MTLGKNRKKLEKKHWVEMVENPRRPIIHWHQLKDPEPGDNEEEDKKKKKDSKVNSGPEGSQSKEGRRRSDILQISQCDEYSISL